MDKRILIVDDEQIIRGMLQIELEDDYDVNTATNAAEALLLLEKEKFDLVISDINMPGMQGYDLYKKIRELYPQTKVVLMTGYNVDDYVRMAKEYGITNIISKTIPFNFDELNTLIKGLVYEDIFGVERHMSDNFEVVKKFTVTNSDEIVAVEREIIGLVEEFYGKDKFLHVLLEETISNAVYHAPVTESGEEKYEKHSDVVLAPEEYVDIALVKDEEKYGISVTDKSGMLTKETILYKIDRNIHAEGLLDENGRGIHMTRLYSDRMIINIKPREKTEIIIINYFQKKFKGYRPLYINEL